MKVSSISWHYREQSVPGIHGLILCQLFKRIPFHSTFPSVLHKLQQKTIQNPIKSKSKDAKHEAPSNADNIHSIVNIEKIDTRRRPFPRQQKQRQQWSNDEQQQAGWITNYTKKYHMQMNRSSSPYTTAVLPSLILMIIMIATHVFLVEYSFILVDSTVAIQSSLSTNTAPFYILHAK